MRVVAKSASYQSQTFINYARGVTQKCVLPPAARLRNAEWQVIELIQGGDEDHHLASHRLCNHQRAVFAKTAIDSIVTPSRKLDRKEHPSHSRAPRNCESVPSPLRKTLLRLTGVSVLEQ